ncbi:hypothetical protein WA026_015479 [Henosepilachna vigintioctopunctata]|uniref:Uncharacterized protein n=1 Tax=Henosepilachna vigintioctopunctata TaxID=420089 RepID=A0AAW1UCF3_9CUCU
MTTLLSRRHITKMYTLLDVVRNLFSPNLVTACISQFQTNPIPPSDYSKVLEDRDTKWHHYWEMGSEGKPLSDAVDVLSEAIM